MKKIFSVVAIVFAFVLSSCTKSIDADFTPDVEYVTVSLEVGGELDVTYSPMTKAGVSDGMYGVQVYRIDNGEKTPYAFGVFTHCPTEITFAKGDVYSITMDYIVGADYETLSGTNEMRNVCLEAPFNTYKWMTYNINEFTYTNSDYLWSLGGEIYELGLGYDRYTSVGSISYNNTYDRYYGKVENYKPTENSTVEINMLHMASSLTVRLNTEGEPIENDIYLYFSNLYKHGKTYKFTKNNDYYEVSIPIFSMSQCENYYSLDIEELKRVNLSIGTLDNIAYYYSGNIIVERNCNIHVTYTISNKEHINNGFGITNSDDSMSDYNIAL